jgi:murein DD-endopeptidase MepM/ murein hydrolase activator NlpD
MKHILLFFFFFTSIFALEYKISSHTTANAKSLYIEFTKERGVVYEKLVVGKRSYAIYKHPLDSSKLYAYLPTSYYERPKHQKVKLLYKKGSKEMSEVIDVDVKDAGYKKEKIQVQKSKVNPKSKAVKKRTSREYKEAMDIYGHATRKNYISSAFIMPMHSKITSAFGTARVYNGSLKGYHSGTDFRAKVGTPLIAVNDGKVVLAKDRFYAGNSVIIDHGQGVYSCYYHLSRFDVKRGDMVKKGQQIGLSGATGRITGPHLHFSMRVGGLQVDPLQFIELVNKNIFKEN